MVPITQRQTAKRYRNRTAYNIGSTTLKRRTCLYVVQNSRFENLLIIGGTMKFKIVTDGSQYILYVKRFPMLWWSRELPDYSSVELLKAACFRVYGKVPQNIVVQNVNVAQQAQP